MSLWRTLLFALIAAGLGAYIWLVEQPRIKDEAEPERLMTFDPQKVASVSLSYPEATSIQAIKEDGDWRLSAPLAADADDGAVANLLEQIAKTEVQRRILGNEAEPLATYGLEGDGAQARVTLMLDNDEKLPDIVVGRTTPVGYDAFARVEGRDEVLVVPLLLHSGVKKDVFALREKTLFAVAVDDALKVTLNHLSRNETIVAEREGDRWKLTVPIEDLADEEQIESLVGSLGQLTAVAYYDGDEVDRETFGLTAPSLVVDVELGDGKSAGFALGAKTNDAPPGYYIERSGDGQVAKVPEWVEARFGKRVDDLRDKHMFSCDHESITRVSFERRDGASFVLEREGDSEWRMKPDPGRPLREDLVKRTITGLATLAGKEVAADIGDGGDLSLYGLDPPEVVIEVSGADGVPCGRALAGVTGDETETPAYHIKRATGSLVMTVPAYLYSRTNMVPGDFLAPEDQPVGDDPAGESGDEPAND